MLDLRLTPVIVHLAIHELHPTRGWEEEIHLLKVWGEETLIAIRILRKIKLEANLQAIDVNYVEEIILPLMTETNNYVLYMEKAHKQDIPVIIARKDYTTHTLPANMETQ